MREAESRGNVVEDQPEHVVLNEETSVVARFQNKQLGKGLGRVIVSF